MSKTRFLLRLFLCLATFPLSILTTTIPVSALEIFAAEARPSSFEEEGVIKGFSVEIAKEVARRIGYPTLKIHLLPFRRAIYVPRQQSGVVLTNIVRNRSRENHYKWLYKTTDISSHYVTKSPGISYTHETAAKLNLVGVFSGSAVHIALKKQKGVNIRAARDEQTNLKMLMAGRIDAWYSSTVLIRGALLNLPSISWKDLVIGERVGNIISVYAAASLDMPDEEVLKWRKAFETLKEDGTYQTIMERYLKPVPIFKNFQ